MRRNAIPDFRVILTLAGALALASCAATVAAPAPQAAVATEPPVKPAPAHAPLAAAPDAGAARTATLTVTVQGVLPQKSMLLVGLFDELRYKVKPPPFHQDGPAKSPVTVVTFRNLKPGRYAVKVLQDMNGNSDMDKTLIGIPEEPFGLSNDIKPVASEPGFDRTGFEVRPGDNAIVINLQQM